MKSQIEDIWNTKIKGNQYNLNGNLQNFNGHLNPKTFKRIQSQWKAPNFELTSPSKTTYFLCLKSLDIILGPPLNNVRKLLAGAPPLLE